MSTQKTFVAKVAKTHEEQDRDIVARVTWKRNNAQNGVYAKFSPIWGNSTYREVTTALTHLGIVYHSQMGGFEVLDGGGHDNHWIVVFDSDMGKGGEHRGLFYPRVRSQGQG